MGEPTNYSKNVRDAYNAVKDLSAGEQYKLEGFKIVLKASVGLGSNIYGSISEPASAATVTKANQVKPKIAGSDWASKIATMLELTVDQVEEIYFLDGEDLKLIINKKRYPETASLSTQHVAGLIAGGRQAMGLDTNGTAFPLIKDALVANNCFNKKNWTGYIKLLGSKFLFDGSAANQTIKLTNKAYDEVGVIAKSYLAE